MIRNIIHRSAIVVWVFFLELSGICAQATEKLENKLSLGFGIGTGIEMENDSRLAFGVSGNLKYSLNPKTAWIFRSHYFRHISTDKIIEESITRQFQPVMQWQVALGWETALIGTLKPTMSKRWGLGWGVHAGYGQVRYTVEHIDYFPGHKHYNYTSYRSIQHALVLSSGLTLYRSIGQGALFLETHPQLNIAGKTHVKVADGISNPDVWTESYSSEGMEFSGVMINLGYRITW